MICDVDNSFYVQRNMLIVDEKFESEVKLIHLLTRYGAKFSDSTRFLYDTHGLREFERLERVKTELNPFEDVNARLGRHLDKIVPIRTHLRLLSFVYKLNLPTMILNSSTASRSFNRHYHNHHASNRKSASGGLVETIGRRAGSPQSDQSNVHSTSTQPSDQSNSINNDDFNNDVDEDEDDVKRVLINNLNDLAGFIQHTVIDAFEKQFYLEQIESLYELLARFTNF